MYNPGMIMESLAKAIKESGKSRYRIAKDTGVDNTVLFRIVNGGNCNVQTLEVLCEYLGLELKPKKKKGKLIGFEFGRKTTKVVIGKKKVR